MRRKRERICRALDRSIGWPSFVSGTVRLFRRKGRSMTPRAPRVTDRRFNDGLNPPTHHRPAADSPPHVRARGRAELEKAPGCRAAVARAPAAFRSGATRRFGARHFFPRDDARRLGREDGVVRFVLASLAPRGRPRVPRASPRRFEDRAFRPPRRVSPLPASSTVDRQPKTVDGGARRIASIESHHMHES